MRTPSRKFQRIGNISNLLKKQKIEMGKLEQVKPKANSCPLLTLVHLRGGQDN
jgi:tRNA1(Val) A37 N6-methylase TrmN6